jgi:hypothetical protein
MAYPFRGSYRRSWVFAYPKDTPLSLSWQSTTSDYISTGIKPDFYINIVVVRIEFIRTLYDPNQKIGFFDHSSTSRHK